MDKNLKSKVKYWLPYFNFSDRNFILCKYHEDDYASYNELYDCVFKMKRSV